MIEQMTVADYAQRYNMTVPAAYARAKRVFDDNASLHNIMSVEYISKKCMISYVDTKLNARSRGKRKKD